MTIGKAIDINSLQNPLIKDGMVRPRGAIYDTKKPGTITEDSFIVVFMKSREWTWGGDWDNRKDYQHFAKHSC